MTRAHGQGGSASALDNVKLHLRRQMLAKRRKLAPNVPRAAVQIAGHLTPLLDDSLGVLAGYWPVREELDAYTVMRTFPNRVWALPVVTAPDRPLTFRLFDLDNPPPAGSFGIPEPGPEAHSVTPSLILVPLLAFDRSGMRLGYGGGYYDRTLAALCQPAPFTIGLAYSFQELDTLPKAPHDKPLDRIVTEQELIIP